MARYCHNCTFLEGFSIEHHEDFYITLSLRVQFPKPFGKIYFCQIYFLKLPDVDLDKYFFNTFSYKSVILI